VELCSESLVINEKKKKKKPSSAFVLSLLWVLINLFCGLGFLSVALPLLLATLYRRPRGKEKIICDFSWHCPCLPP
jgi:hypothetical protein